MANISERSVMGALLFASLGAILGCDGLSFGTSIPSRTVLTSSTLSGPNAAGQDVPLEEETPEDPVGDEPDYGEFEDGEFWEDASDGGGPEPAGLGLTPENVTGEVLSLLFATAGQVDEGVVVFGDSRPDIAATSATLYEFDLANPDPISAQIELKPGFVGGNSEHMVILFGHLDVNVNLDGQDKVVRVATASVGGMQRGDKLLQNASGDFEWYDLDTASFTSTRPANPAVTDEIASFTDPIRPNLVFYPFNVFLVSPVPLDPGALAVALSVDVEVNFMMSDAVTLVGQSSESIDDATFITSFSMTQSVEGFGDSGFLADATMTVNP